MAKRKNTVKATRPRVVTLTGKRGNSSVHAFWLLDPDGRRFWLSSAAQAQAAKDMIRETYNSRERRRRLGRRTLQEHGGQTSI